MVKKLINATPKEFISEIKDYTYWVEKYQCLTTAAQEADHDGFWLEFGSYSGETLNILSEMHPKVYGFDSWEGLPEDWNKDNPKGTFDLKGKIPFQPNDKMILKKGWFTETVPTFINDEEINRISFIHLDADLYSSTKCVLDNFKPYFKGKCIMVFDEFFGYEGWENHEYKAFKEFLGDMEDKINDIKIISHSAPGYHPVAFNVNFK